MGTMKNPKRNAAIVLQQKAPGLSVSLPSGEAFRIEGVDAAVLQAADGTNDLVALVAAVRRIADPAATRETVFASLDRLADVGLLESRVAPPASGNRTTRRDMMRLVGATAAFAVVGPAMSAFGAAPDFARTGEEHSKNVRAAEETAKLEMREARAAEQKVKVAWRDAEETQKQERLDVQAAERNLDSAERDLKAAEEKSKRVGTKEAEEYEKRSQKAVEEAKRLAEQENKQYVRAEERAAEAQKKLQEQRRVSEEVAKKTNTSETARSRRETNYESEQAAKAAEQVSKAQP